jgi:hypothetical protein
LQIWQLQRCQNAPVGRPRFATEYKSLLGALPSTTLARGRRGTSRVSALGSAFRVMRDLPIFAESE